MVTTIVLFVGANRPKLRKNDGDQRTTATRRGVTIVAPPCADRSQSDLLRSMVVPSACALSERCSRSGGASLDWSRTSPALARSWFRRSLWEFFLAKYEGSALHFAPEQFTRLSRFRPLTANTRSRNQPWTQLDHLVPFGVVRSPFADATRSPSSRAVMSQPTHPTRTESFVSALVVGREARGAGASQQCCPKMPARREMQ